MNFLIIGAGALGLYFGGRLHEAGHHVKFLVRKRRAKQIEEKGISIKSDYGNYTIEYPELVFETANIRDVDLVLLTVKGYHLDKVIDQLQPLIDNGAKVLPVLNGIEHIERLQNKLGKNAILGGLAYIFATLDENGHMIQSGKLHELIFGPLDPSQQSIVTRLKEVMDGAKFNVAITNNILHDMWKKYMFINAISGVTTAGNFTLGTIRSHSATLQLLENVLMEMKDLANSFGILLTEQDVQEQLDKVFDLPADATSSMHHDWRNGLPLEVEHLQGGALRLAKQTNVSLPSISTLYGLIKPKENL